MHTALAIGPPEEGEAAEYYFKYIGLVPGEDILAVLGSQLDELLPFLHGIGEEESLRRYAPDKWTIRQVVNHVTDCERLFVFRAFWFARGFDTPLPSFDQNTAATAAGADEISWEKNVDELVGVRRATLSFFRNLPAEAWKRRGEASGNPFSVRALAYIVAGHLAHHEAVLRERYF